MNRTEMVSPRVSLGIERNINAVPQLHPFRAQSAAESWKNTRGEDVHTRRATMLENILANQPVTILEDELIVGMKTATPKGSPVYPEINCDWVERDLETLSSRSDTPFFVSEETKTILKESVFPYFRGQQIVHRIQEQVKPEAFEADRRGIIYNYFGSRTIGHITVDYSKVLTEGLSGVVKQVRGSMNNPQCTPDEHCFLAGIERACRAAASFSERYAKEAERLAGIEKSPERRSELLEISAICRHVPWNPARSYHEALQSFWFVQLVLNLETNGHAISPGRFDQYIYPFYSKDLELEKITREHAQELLDLLWVKFDEITLAKDSGESETSSSYPEFQNLNIGGLTKDGRDAVNDISYMCLTALEHTRLPQPGLSAQVSTRTPHRFLMRCAEVLRLGTGMPAIFNSDEMILGMTARGKSLAHARDGSINGCVSPNCGGRDRMASSGYFNLAKCLELALNNGRERISGEAAGPETGNPETFQTFDRLLEAFKAQVSHFTSIKVAYDDAIRKIYADHCPVPFTSALIDDCIDKRKDWHAGGARYNQAVISGVGVGTVADSLSAIMTHVYEEKAITMKELLHALENSWEKNETLRAMLISKTPHYGNDDERADIHAILTQQIFCREVEKHRDIQGAKYWVNLLPTTAHIALGKATGATPDGRFSGDHLSEGISPVQGHDTKGPTATACSVAKLDHARCNGTLLNLRLSPGCVETEEDLSKLTQLIRGYFDQGGHHMQFNVFDRKTLEKAMVHPEKHRNLLVRVAGYSDYFVLLSPEIQKEILSRTETLV